MINGRCGAASNGKDTTIKNSFSPRCEHTHLSGASVPEQRKVWSVPARSEKARSRIMFQVLTWPGKSRPDEEEAEDEEPGDGKCIATERKLTGTWGKGRGSSKRCCHCTHQAAKGKKECPRSNGGWHLRVTGPRRAPPRCCRSTNCCERRVDEVEGRANPLSRAGPWSRANGLRRRRGTAATCGRSRRWPRIRWRSRNPAA